MISTRRDEVSLTLHGLDVDNGEVRAGVFVRKLAYLLRALRDADRFANEKRSFNYVVSGLSPGSAQVRYREKQTVRRRPRSSVETLQSAITAIYNADPAVHRFPERLIRRIGDLSNGTDEEFSHGELAF